MSKNEGFGRRVRLRRERLGAKRKRLAELTEIGPKRLEMIEFGQLDESDLTQSQRGQLADVLQCSVDWLIGGEEPAVPRLGVGVIANRRHSGGLRQQELAFAEQRCPHCHHPVSGARCDECGQPNV